MSEIMKLMGAGRLTDATNAIQARLRGVPDASSDPAMSGAGMKDITPRARALPGPETSRANPRTAKARWERRKGPIPYRLYRPANPVADAPLIVMLHGCTQNPDDFALGTRMNLAAERIGAHVVWPEQTRAANANGCWTWFEPAHQHRQGEPAAIAGIIGTIKAELTPRASGIHVAGLSAGGAMAAILGAAYPDLIASIGVHSGLPVGAAHNVASAFAAMQSGAVPANRMPVPAIVFHGTSDRTVALSNGLSFVPSDTPTSVDTLTRDGRAVTVTRTNSGPRTELWQVDGLGHAWSGGNAKGSYADPAGPDATAEMIRFFAQVDAARR